VPVSSTTRDKTEADEWTRTADLLITSEQSVLQGVCTACKSPISKPFSLLWLAQCCTVLRSRWCQSGVRSVCITRGALRRRTLSSFPRLPLVMLDRIPRRIANLRRMRQSMLGVIMPASGDPAGRDLMTEDPRGCEDPRSEREQSATSSGSYLAGARASTPFALATFVLGISFGVLARSLGGGPSPRSSFR
jgi:hypothetical protein